MSELLVNLCGVPKVWGAALYTEEGVCIESRLEAPFEEGFVHTVLKDLVAATESYRFLDPAPISMAVAQAHSGLLAFMSRNRMRVLALAGREVNPVFLHVAFGSLAKRLDAFDSDMVLSLSHSSPVAPVSGSHLTIEASQIERVPPVGAVTVEEMRQILIAFTEFAGPAAKMVLKQQLRELGYGSSSLPRGQLEIFLDRLTLRLPTPSQREKFRASLRRR
ncbi:MAG: hypothetical protein AAFU79_07350 [Myxococcota bacterium]